ncbi:MAG: cyclic pyranopterin monophosphate synthase MoaC [Candidatus Bathyarchaeia archaeon]
MSMVDVSDKPEILREATATGTVKLKNETIRLIKEGKVAKGDPFHTAKIAGILAAKKTSTLIPLCHTLPLTSVEIDVKIEGKTRVKVTANVKAKAPTGVEMEALAATATSLLTIWDMVKQYEKDAHGQYPSTTIENIHVVKKVKKTS